MTSWMKVAGYHLVDRRLYVWAPWAILTFAFIVNLVITAFQGGPNPTKALISIYAVFLFVGVLSIARSLPFGLTLGVSRRSYYLGTVLLAVALAAVYGLALALLEVIERATGGWGVNLHFFQVAYVFPGPWYLIWLTSFVGLVVVFVYGMCLGIVFRRWDVIGLAVFIAAQAVVVLAGASWATVSHFFTDLSAAGLTGLLGALAAVLLASGYVMIRRVTV
jgi:hypothetical protein